MSRWAVPEDLAGDRVDRIVSHLAHVSRSQARALVDAGAVAVDGAPVKASDRLAAGTEIDVSLPSEPSGPSADAGVEFTVAFADDDVIVVNKPPGLVVHPGAGVTGATLVNGLLARYRELGELGEDRRWGIVHRIDKDTSGLLMVARTPSAFDSLQEALRRREVSRSYLTLVHGRIEAAAGTIEAPIGRDPRRPTRMTVRSDGREARTHYRRLATWSEPPRTLLHVALDTGRTHQIRVHMQAIGHPIVGDRTYGKPGAGSPGRTFLHAYALVFPHPATGGSVEVHAPLPQDLQDAIAELGTPEAGRLPVIDVDG